MHITVRAAIFEGMKASPRTCEKAMNRNTCRSQRNFFANLVFPSINKVKSLQEIYVSFVYIGAATNG